MSRQSPESTAHIYCQLDSIGLIAVTTQDEESVFEMTLMPENALNLDQMFEELSVCASLHPDPTAEEEEEGLLFSFYFIDESRVAMDDW